MNALQTLARAWGDDFATHLVVSTLVLAAALAAAAWISPLTARTRHAILLAGMSATLLPPILFEWLIEMVAGRPVRALPFQLPQLGRTSIPLPAGEPGTASWPGVLAAVWLGVAVLLFARWWITSRRLLSSALRGAARPPARAIAALESARQRMQLARSVDLITSPLTEAPAVVRIVRPLLVLPADACEVLDDDELESILCHECAHVARHDNLIGAGEALVCSLFWFNPLIWLAHRRIGATREAACDERVADRVEHAETYVGALAKFCVALLAPPRVAGVSCMASAQLTERMKHLMTYPSLRGTALPHRSITIAASVAVLLLAITAGALTAEPVNALDPYSLDYSISASSDQSVTLRARITDTRTSAVVAEPSLRAPAGEASAMEINESDRRFRITVTPDASGGGQLELQAWEGGTEVQHTVRRYPVQQAQAEPPSYSGEPISLDLENADLRDVMRTFSQITGTNIVVAPEVSGTITVHFKNTPWDEAFARILSDNGLSYRVEEKTIHVFAPGR